WPPTSPHRSSSPTACCSTGPGLPEVPPNRVAADSNLLRPFEAGQKWIPTPQGDSNAPGEFESADNRAASSLPSLSVRLGPTCRARSAQSGRGCAERLPGPVPALVQIGQCHRLTGRPHGPDRIRTDGCQVQRVLTTQETVRPHTTGGPPFAREQAERSDLGRSALR